MAAVMEREPTPLKRHLEDNFLTVGWLAAQCGIGRPHMSEIVNGIATHYTMRKWAPRISAILGVPLLELFPEEQFPWVSRIPHKEPAHA